MTADHSEQAPREAAVGRSPPPAGGVPSQAPSRRVGDAPMMRKQRRRRMRWIVHAVLFVALAVGVFGLLPRIGGLAHDTAGLRHARPAFAVAAVFAQAVSLGCYTLLYRSVLASPGAGWRSRW